jgi:hypothetical protein
VWDNVYGEDPSVMITSEKEGKSKEYLAKYIKHIFSVPCILMMIMFYLDNVSS